MSRLLIENELTKIYSFSVLYRVESLKTDENKIAWCCKAVGKERSIHRIVLFLSSICTEIT